MRRFHIKHCNGVYLKWYTPFFILIFKIFISGTAVPVHPRRRKAHNKHKSTNSGRSVGSTSTSKEHYINKSGTVVPPRIRRRRDHIKRQSTTQGRSEVSARTSNEKEISITRISFVYYIGGYTGSRL